MSQLVDRLVSVLGAVPTPWAYALIGALVFAEAGLFVGFVLPGETAVLLGGVMAATGKLSVLGLILVVIGGAIVGDSVGYEVGRRTGPRLLRSRLLRRHLPRLEAAQHRLRTRGAITVIVGRFTAFLRAVTPALCGMSRMPYRRFLAFNALGGVLWGTAVTLLGFLAGRSFQRVQTGLGGVSALLLLLFVAAAAVAWHRTRRHGTEPPAALVRLAQTPSGSLQVGRATVKPCRLLDERHRVLADVDDHVIHLERSRPLGAPIPTHPQGSS